MRSVRFNLWRQSLLLQELHKRTLQILLRNPPSCFGAAFRNPKMLTNELEKARKPDLLRRPEAPVLKNPLPGVRHRPEPPLSMNKTRIDALEFQVVAGAGPQHQIHRRIGAEQNPRAGEIEVDASGRRI